MCLCLWRECVSLYLSSDGGVQRLGTDSDDTKVQEVETDKAIEKMQSSYSSHKAEVLDMLVGVATDVRVVVPEARKPVGGKS